jgi:L-alanine-DL-glutamate epimerase-like enolase superfamily enzyme
MTESGRPWTTEGLAALYTLAASNADLPAIGQALGRTRAEVDLALWALVGRSVPDAVARLNAGRRATPAAAGRMSRFLRRMFPEDGR